LVRLKVRLEEIIDPMQDQVIFMRLCANCAVQIETLGLPTTAHDAQDVVIVS
jgi:CRISPR/Cas system-associated endoribonuclease Cas2